MENNSCMAPEEESKNLIALKRIAPRLKEASRWSNIVIEDLRDIGFKRINSKKGHIFYKVLDWSHSRAIMDNVASAGSKFEAHQHPGIEIFMVYKGELIINWKDKDYRIKNIKDGGKPFYIDSRHEHTGRCEVDTEFIAITVPGDLDWRPAK